MNEKRITAIRQALEERFRPEYLEVEDESHLHEGHAGAESGMGHFRVTIVAQAFQGMPALQRHKAVFDALGSLMKTDIHAVSVRPIAPDEF
jgi:stress-induced morphogen